MRSGAITRIGAVFAGGLVGSACRIGLSGVIPSPEGGFPAGTLVINVAGAFLIGFFLSRRESSASSAQSLRFWAIGVLGSFTTFSAFSLEAVELAADGHVVSAFVYVLASILAGLLAAVGGDRLGRRPV